MSENTVDLQEQFSRMCRLLHSLHHHRKHGPTGDPHRGQGRVLSLLTLRPEISQKELSYLLDIRQQSLGELLVKLENKGYIVRTPSESDNRAIDIRLTESGASAIAEQGEDDLDLFQELTSEERITLSGYLERIITGMEERFGDGMSCCGGKQGHRHHGGRMHGPMHDQPGADAPRHGHRCGCGDQEHGHGRGRCRGHGMAGGARGGMSAADCE